MSNALSAGLKSFLKFELYTALTIAAAQIQSAGSLDLIQWPIVGSAIVAGLIKGAVTYLTTVGR
jgi:hypothetical protein